MPAVLASGCFDVLHTGHILLLQEAASYGDWLIVAVNSDRMVRQLKGPNRPLVPAALRVQALQALRCVDHVIVFHTRTVAPVLERFKPQTWVKGGDYTLETLHPLEVRTANRLGCAIKIIPERVALHTSNLAPLLSLH